MVFQISFSTSTSIARLMPPVLTVVGVALIGMVVQITLSTSTTVSSSTRHFDLKADRLNIAQNTLNLTATAHKYQVPFLLGKSTVARLLTCMYVPNLYLSVITCT